MFRTYRLIFTCEFKLPEALQNQLPYHPDSIRVAVEFSEQTDYQPGSPALDLNLQRYNTIVEYKLLTAYPFGKTFSLAWQDVTRFNKNSHKSLLPIRFRGIILHRFD